MRYTSLGRSGLKVSAVGLGAMNFGIAPEYPCGEAEAGRIIGDFLDAGGNLIDTADIYSRGESEIVIGRAVAKRRDRVVLATKARMRTGEGANAQGLSRLHLSRALDESLRRMGTDYVDLYQCHRWDDSTPIEETMATLDGFVRSGKVRYIGCSNFTAAQIVEAQWAAETILGTSFVGLQAQYSLINRAIEAEVVATCRRRGLGVLAWSPLGGGVLSAGRSGRWPSDGGRVSRFRTSSLAHERSWAEVVLNPANSAVARAVGEVADELECAPAAVATAWLSQRPGVSSVIAGPRSRSHLSAYLAGAELELPVPFRTRLDEVSVFSTTRPVNGLRLPGQS